MIGREEFFIEEDKGGGGMEGVSEETQKVGRRRQVLLFIVDLDSWFVYFVRRQDKYINCLEVWFGRLIVDGRRIWLILEDIERISFNTVVLWFLRDVLLVGFFFVLFLGLELGWIMLVVRQVQLVLSFQRVGYCKSVVLAFVGFLLCCVLFVFFVFSRGFLLCFFENFELGFF